MSVYCFTQLLDSYPTPVHTLAADLAALIRVTAPGAVEAVRPTRRCVRYSHPRCGYFCGLYPQESSVQLLFEFGVLLPDPDGLLRGTGPYVRFVAVREYYPLYVPALRQLIAAAFNLPRRRADKIALAEEGRPRRGHATLTTEPPPLGSQQDFIHHAGPR